MYNNVEFCMHQNGNMKNRISQQVFRSQKRMINEKKGIHIPYQSKEKRVQYEMLLRRYAMSNFYLIAAAAINC